MRRLVGASIVSAFLLALAANPAHAVIGFEEVDVTFTKKDGSAALQAGEHPYAMTTRLFFETEEDSVLGPVPTEDPKNLKALQIPGFVGSPEATQRCSAAVFLDVNDTCPINTIVGRVDVVMNSPDNVESSAVYNLIPPPGVAAKLGFEVANVPVTIEAGVNPDPPYNVIARLVNIPQVLTIYGSELTLWGNPAASDHDAERGGPAGIPNKPFLTLPRSCRGPLSTIFEIDSWQNPGVVVQEAAVTHNDAIPPVNQGFTGCDSLHFAATISGQPTTKAAESPSGLEFGLDFENPGINNPDGRSSADLRAARVLLPEGMTANPSLAEGLEACSEAQLAAEEVNPDPGSGCPEASKVGTVRVKTPLLAEELQGSLYIAEPFANPAGSLIALYMVVRSPTLGIIVTQTLEVRPDPQTGRLETISKDLPEVPLSHVQISLREGARSPLISPPQCGTHTIEAELFPSSGAAPLPARSSFQIISGPEGGGCPPSGALPFRPGFQAGSIDNNAARHTPFYMRLTRRDGDQGLTRFSSSLPPGLVAKLAGVSQCPDAAIVHAASKTGLAERATPSCPASSRIGGALAGAGVGSQLIYVPGDIYLAGPYNGAPLSVVAIVPAVAGPFDVGTVVTRVALNVDPRTAEVHVDGSRSDPIPTILAGIPLRVRDIRVNVDRPNFTLNPTSCNPFSVGAAMFGSAGAQASLSVPFQAANCASLGFRPRLNISLKGRAKRGGHPALKAVYRARPGDANVRRVALTFPRSAFVENANFRTICTRVQFADNTCPPGSIYGKVRAFTPLLDEVLEGPVYLRSSDNLLPDAVFALKGIVDAEVTVRLDAIRGRLRATVTSAPDVPVSRVIVEMQGGRKGLIVNSRHLCVTKNRGRAKLLAQSGARQTMAPIFKAEGCRGKHRRR